MNGRWRGVAIGAGVLALVAVVSLVLVARQRRGDPVWTDASGAVRVLAQEQDPRRVLWQPPKPVLRPDAPNADEYEPRLSADGTLMVFVRGKPGQNADLFESRFVNGAWSEARAIGAINTERDELGPELASDGRSLYFYSDRAGGLGGFDLWVSRRQTAPAGRGADVEEWGEPVNLGASVNSVENEYGVAIAPDGATLYFSSNRPRAGEVAGASDPAWAATLRERRARNDYDLYAIALSRGASRDPASGHASSVQPVGTEPFVRAEAQPATVYPLDALNTNADEGAPAVSPFGDFLYFASDRSGGHGGHDLYRAAIKGRTLGVAENLGSTVNGAANELDPALSSDGFRLYFSSDRGDAGVPRVATQDASGGAVVAAAAAYRLWWTASREVTRQWEARPGPGLAGVLRELWPWLLLVLLGLALLAMLARMASDELWRRRLARMSLLAKCLLLSLLLHAAIAWMLALWQVGSKLGLSTRPSGGGVRVSLRSESAGAGGSGGDAGALAGQLRSDTTREPGEAIESPAHEVIRAAAASDALESSVASLEASDASRAAMERSAVVVRSPSAAMGESGAMPVNHLASEAAATRVIAVVPALGAAAPLAGEEASATAMDPRGVSRRASAASSPDLRLAGAALAASARAAGEGGADDAGVLSVDGRVAEVARAAAAPGEFARSGSLAARGEALAVPAAPASLEVLPEARAGVLAGAVAIGVRAGVASGVPEAAIERVSVAGRAGRESTRVVVESVLDVAGEAGEFSTPATVAVSEPEDGTSKGLSASASAAVVARGVAVPLARDGGDEVASESAIELVGSGGGAARAPASAAGATAGAVEAALVDRAVDSSSAGGVRVALGSPAAVLGAARAMVPSATGASVGGVLVDTSAARAPAMLPAMAGAPSGGELDAGSFGAGAMASGALGDRAGVAMNGNVDASAAVAAGLAERAASAEATGGVLIATSRIPAPASSGVRADAVASGLAAASVGAVVARAPGGLDARRSVGATQEGGEGNEPAREGVPMKVGSLGRVAVGGGLEMLEETVAGGAVVGIGADRSAAREGGGAIAIRNGAMDAGRATASQDAAVPVVGAGGVAVMASSGAPRLPSLGREDAVADRAAGGGASSEVVPGEGFVASRPVPSTLAAASGEARGGLAIDPVASSRGDRAVRVEIGAPDAGFEGGRAGAPASALAAAARPAAVGTGASLLSARLPAAPPDPEAEVAGASPAEAATAVESFAQRDPEVREEMLERGGGSERTEEAVRASLAWLARMQEPNGRWSGRGFTARCDGCGGAAQVDADVAMTGLSLLCFLGAGHTHTEEGPYQDAVQRALDWLVAGQTGDGDLRRGETMYGQTVATVALCEALAMTKDERLAVPARRAVELVVRRATGPRAGVGERDTSVIGWLIMSLQSARRAGIEVPQAPFDAARNWLESVRVAGEAGAYAYDRGGGPSPAMTAEAMFVQQLLGRDRGDPLMRRSAEYLLRTPPRWKDGAPTYYWYYATLALFEHQGEAWSAWNGAVVPELLESQRAAGDGAPGAEAAAGSWDPQDQWSQLGGRIYQTAICTLSLEVYYRYRPAGVR